MCWLWFKDAARLLSRCVGSWGLCSGHCGMACGQGRNIWIWNEARTLTVKKPTTICLPEYPLDLLALGNTETCTHKREKEREERGNRGCFTSVLNSTHFTDFLPRKLVHIWVNYSIWGHFCAVVQICSASYNSLHWLSVNKCMTNSIQYVAVGLLSAPLGEHKCPMRQCPPPL